MPKVLFARADFDVATLYLSSYAAAKLLPFAKDNGYEVMDLFDDCGSGRLSCPTSQYAARLEPFETQMTATPPPDIVIGCGHGNEVLFTGQDLEVLLKANVNDDLCSGKKVYLWSCLTGVTLGPQMVQKTCPEFYGYQSDFTFVFHPDYANPPSSDDPSPSEKCTLNDPWARAFFDSGLATGYAVLLGMTPEEIYTETIKRYDYWWDYWTQQNDSMADDILTWLNWDRSNFIAITPTGLQRKPPVVVGPTLASSPLIPLGIAGALLFLLSRSESE